MPYTTSTRHPFSTGNIITCIYPTGMLQKGYAYEVADIWYTMVILEAFGLISSNTKNLNIKEQIEKNLNYIYNKKS